MQKDHNNADLLEKSDSGHKDLVFFYDFVSALNRQVITTPLGTEEEKG